MPVRTPAGPDLRDARRSGHETGGDTIANALGAAAERLGPRIESPRMEAEVLLAHVLDAPRSGFRAWPERIVPAAVLEPFQQLVEQRMVGVPVAYLTGAREFWSIHFEVNDLVLIPRHETERLVEVALDTLPQNTQQTVADAGTGCGAIAVSLARERSACRIIATDVSRHALTVAKRNSLRTGTRNVSFMAGHWLAPIGVRCIDVVISNPPYIAERDPHLWRGDLRYEPRIALAAGDDGLDAIRELIDDARRCLRPGGHLLFEHGFDQGEAARKLLTVAGYSAIVTHEDYAGQERVTQ
ncbi:MAG TPA: peptide chain release factor N(5)-glutamine methyltransferase, partial [Gammaproteobacteria bacterium]